MPAGHRAPLCEKSARSLPTPSHERHQYAYVSEEQRVDRTATLTGHHHVSLVMALIVRGNELREGPTSNVRKLNTVPIGPIAFEAECAPVLGLDVLLESARV